MKSPEANQCPECGVPLPEYWPKGFCPQCSLKGALEGHAANESTDPISASSPARMEESAGTPGGRRTRFGDYELIEEIGRGGMGVIYRARQVSLNRSVALKMILAGQFAGKQEVLRFRSEAEAAAHLQHPNIVRIHETGEHDGHHYFSMDLVEGRTLADLVRDGALPGRRAANYAQRIAEAIHYAHSQGVLHRDLKPSNVVIDGNDEPRITDFGLAKRMRNDFGVTVTGQVLGSPNFMPPEQTSAKSGNVGPASDVYGVGAILYHLLTGRPPFQAETIEELLLLLRDAEPLSPRLLNPSVARDLETICLKCLEKEPARRYASAQVLADELGRFIRDEPIQSRPLPITGKLWRWCRRRRAIAALSASVLVLLIAITLSSTIAAWRVNRARASAQRANRELRDAVAVLELQRAENFFHSGDAGTAVAHLTAILRHNPSNQIAATRLASALVHRDWALRTAVTMQHTARVEMLRFSPDGRHILSASRDHTATIWDFNTGKPIAVMPHSGPVFSARYDAGGARVITASEDGTARIWDALTGKPRSPRLRHGGQVYWAEFSPDEHWAVTASADRTACIWDASSGALKRQVRAHTTPVVLARFTPDSKRIITSGSYGSIRVWDVDSGEMLFRLEDRKNPLVAFDLSPDGKRLVSVCQDEVARLWDLETLAEISLPGEIKAVVYATFSPDSRTLVTTSHDTTARLWDVNTGLAVGSPLNHDGTVASAHFSPDGQKIVTLSKDRSARIWDAQTQRLVCPPMRAAEEFTQADFWHDGSRLTTAGREGTIYVWDFQPRRFAGLSARFKMAITTVDFSDDGESLLATSFDGTARVFDPRTMAPLASLPHEAGLYLAKFSPDGSRVFTASAGKVRLWDWRKAVVVGGPFEHPTRIEWVHFNAKGDQLVTASSNGVARVWKSATWEPMTPPLLHAGPVLMARFSPDGRFVGTASDRSARVWNARTGEAVSRPLVHKDNVRCVDFSPDGKKILTASADDTARIWEAQTGEPIGPPLQHTRLVERAHFSPDGSRIITASLDYTARIWDAQTGGALTPPLPNDYSLIGVSFTREGESAMTACWNGAVRVWNAQTGQPVSESLDPGYWMWKLFAFDPTNRRMAVGGKDCIVRLWHIPESPTPIPEWFLTFAETVAGIRLGERGQTELVSPVKLDAAIHELKSRGRGDYYAQLARWFLADPANREPAPF